jgi:acetyl-CoA synthetase
LDSQQVRTYVPPRKFIEESNLYHFMKRTRMTSYEELYKQSIADPAWFWSTFEKDFGFEWFSSYHQVMDSSQGLPWTKWFVGGLFNIAYNCLERQIRRNKIGDKIAYYCENETGSGNSVSYSELNIMTNRIANVLKLHNVSKGDVVCVYMSNTWKAVCTLLACAKLGAIHCTIFSGLGPVALKTRIEECNPKVVVTSNGYYRRGRKVNLIDELAQALSDHSHIQSVLVDLNIDENITNVSKIESAPTFFLQDEIRTVSSEFQCEELDSEHPLFILFTSGTTGKPKATVHVHGGFAVVAAQQTLHPLDLKASDVLFWPTDIGWISAHIWLIYGLLLTGSTAVLYDGAIDYPTPDRILRIIEKYSVSIFGFSPTGARFLKMACSNLLLSHYNLSTIRLMALTGEPIDKSTWLWLFEMLGRSRTPIFNNSGGTEIGRAILGTNPISAIRPSSLGGPQLGFEADILDEEGRHVENSAGYLVVRNPWPSMTRGFWHNEKSYLETYWSRFPNIWYHGDLGLIDRNGDWFILGRVDDVIKVAGHRIGPAEIEEVLLSHRSVAEVAVVAKPNELKGNIVVAYVVLKPDVNEDKEALTKELKDSVERAIGKISRPNEIIYIDSLPKTSTGKILRGVLRSSTMGHAVVA